jgi:catechol 2,3-dioxygenase-like lactoylglutathione lyase family enzyme
MLLGIDHLVIACRDPDASIDRLAGELGLEPGGGGRHERYGTFNRLIFLGDAYLELMGVFDSDLARARGIGAATEALLEAGAEGLASFAIATDDIDGDVARLRRLGAPYDDPAPGERRRRDGEVIRWRTALPERIGPDGLPFLIQHEDAGPEWSAAARQRRRDAIQPFGGRAALAAVMLPVSDPEAAAERHGRLLGLPVSQRADGAAELPIGPQVLRFVPGSTADAVEVVIAGSSGQPRSADLLGCRFRIEVPPAVRD